MKKLTALLMTGILTLGLTACGSTSSESAASVTEAASEQAETNAADNSAENGNESTAAENAEAEAQTFTTTFNLNSGNAENLPEYQFLSGNMKGMLNYDSRIYLDVTLELDGAGSYALESNCYIIEGGKLAEVGDETGIGQTFLTTATGSYEDNGDGTVTIAVPDHATHELKTDTYSSQMKDAVGVKVAGSSEDGAWDSDEEASILELVPETIFTLSQDGSIVTWDYANPVEEEVEETDDEAAKEAEAVPGNEVLAISSDDGGTTFTLYDNGVYEFYFESYDIRDNGTYTYDEATSTLTITDGNGKETVSDVNGDHVVFHYAYSQSDQLTGDYTIAATDLAAALQ